MLEFIGMTPTALPTVSPGLVFGRRLRAARERRGYRQEDLGDRVGASRGGIYKLEEGWANPWLLTMVRLGEELRVNVSWLAGVGPDTVPVAMSEMDAHQVRHGFGGRVRFVREARDLSQHDLARVLGCHNSRVCDIERGAKATPRLDTIVRYCEALEMPLAWALGDDPDVAWLEAKPWEF